MEPIFNFIQTVSIPCAKYIWAMKIVELIRETIKKFS